MALPLNYFSVLGVLVSGAMLFWRTRGAAKVVAWLFDSRVGLAAPRRPSASAEAVTARR